MPSTICSSPRLLVRLPVSPSFLFCRIQKPVNARAGTCRYAIQKLFSRRDNLFPRRGNSFCAPQRHVLPCVEPTLFVRCDHFPETAAGITDPTIAEDYSIMMQSPLAVGWGRLPHEDNAHGLPSHCKGRGRVSNFSNTGIRWATPLGSCQHVSSPGVLRTPRLWSEDAYSVLFLFHETATRSSLRNRGYERSEHPRQTESHTVAHSGGVPRYG